VDFGLTDSERAWRGEVVDFLDEHLTPAVFAENQRGWKDDGGGPAVKQFMERVAERGWFGLNWPREYGGQERSAIEQLIFHDEFEYAGAPSPGITVNVVGPTIIHYGSEADKQRWLPAIASGDLTCALGYSEPDAGSDLASLRTRAELDGDEWVINGAKIWNSGAHYCTHEWLAVRTSNEERKQAGISILIVPLDTPGIEVQPIHTWAGLRTNALFLTDVRVPRDHLFGEVGRGWSYITGALAFERGSNGAGALRRALDDLIQYCGESVDGYRLIDSSSVRRRLAELEIDVELARLLAYQTATLMDQQKIPTVAAAVEKVAATELRIKLADWSTQIVGPRSLLTSADPAAPHGGLFEQSYRQSPLFFFVGGANDVLRDVIARAHGLPRASR
jgi:alkylation response protein AidB-like acyl-CoA dehydrogenase